MPEIIASILLAVSSFFGFAPQQPEVFGAFGDPFLSRQVATTSLSSGKYLRTDGLNSYWDTVVGGAGDFPFTPASWGNSTSTVIGFTQGLFTLGSTTFAGNATTSGNHSFGSIRISDDHIADLAGTNLTVTSGVLNVDNPVVADLTGNVTGNVSGTAGSLGANGSNCASGEYPLGVSATGASEDCTDATTEITSVVTANFPFTPATNWNSTSTVIRDTLGFIGNSSSSLHILGNTYASSTYLTADTATTTNFFGAMLRNCSSNNVLTWTNGLFGCEADDTGSGSTDVVLWANASTSPWVASSLTALSSSTIAFLDMVRATSTNFISTNATTSIQNISSHLRVQDTVRIDNLTSALVQTGSTGILAEYAGTSCTNQFPQSNSALGVWTCDSVNDEDLNLSDITLADFTNDAGFTTFGFPYTPATSWNATSTIIRNTFGFIGNSSTTLHILNNTYASSSQLSIAGILTLPAVASPTIATDGDCAIDTTDGQLRCDVGSRGSLVLSRGEFGVTQQYASTTQGSGTTTFYSISPYNLTISSVLCDFTRHLGVRLGDGTNWSTHIIASSTVGTTTLSSNNVFHRGEKFQWQFGTTTSDTGKEVRGGCTASYTINSE